MKKYFYEYIKRYDQKAIDSLATAFDKLYSKEFELLVSEYEKDINFDYKSAIKKVEKLGQSNGVSEYQSKFVYCLCLTNQMQKYYEQSGYTREFFEDNIKDFDYKMEECRLVKGEYGCFCSEWFEGHFNLTRFKLGRLQFEVRRFPKIIPEITNYVGQGVELDTVSPMINVHIPRSGERLSDDMVKDSFYRAKEFFADEFKGKPIVFCCLSWLLYPKNEHLMKDGSNLKNFFQLFDVVKSGEYDDYSECWRLFDMDFTGNVDDLPEDSSLRKAYKELMNRGEKTGWGFGICVYKK